ncbi:MAG: FapA family protein, partial [Burkholderiales bacterium]|nr:FapA family protein [Burkholderiales bacterium]
MDARDMQLSESATGDVVLTMEPNAERAPFDKAALLQWLAEQGYGAYQHHEEALERAVQVSAGGEERVVLLLAHPVDAVVQVEVSRDAMQAQLSITPAQGGAPASEDDVHAALAASAVVAGIDAVAIAQAVQSQSPDPILVAQGVLPIPGEDAEFLELIAAAPERTPKVDADGRIDYREHGGGIVLVETGALLMRRKPATPGTPGRTVLGKELPPRPGRDVPFADKLSGVAVSADDPNVLVASMTGQPVLVRAGVMVEPILHLPEVDIATGNIHYDGSVHVDGDIAQGMQVQATGDVIVGGAVDGGIVQAQGNIVVKGGVIARARLQADCVVDVRFAEGSELRAGTELVVRQNAIGCELHALDRISVGREVPTRGRLMGGAASAMMGIAAPFIGSADAGLTRLVLGVNPVLQERLRLAIEAQDAQQQRAQSLRKVIEHLRQHGDPKGMLERATASLQDTLAQLTELQAQRETLQQQLALGREARLEIGMALQGAVDLALGGQRVVELQLGGVFD